MTWPGGQQHLAGPTERLVGRGAAGADHKGLTLVHFSAQRKHFLRGIRWVFDGVTITNMAQVDVRS